MVERLRALLERPLDQVVARGILVFALAASMGFAAVTLTAGFDGRPSSTAPRRWATMWPPVDEPAFSGASPGASRIARQDAQDRRGTTAHRLAAREIAGHRALQHLPWRRHGVSIGLVGARGAEAVLAVHGPSLAADRRGWARFLRLYRDDGRSYLPRFQIRRKGARP